MKTLIQKFIADQSGATAIEYALIAAGISLIIIPIINALGGTMNAIFVNLNAQLAPPGP